MVEAGLCGRSCLSCPLHGPLCSGCDNRGCLVLACFKGKRYTGINAAGCIYTSVCPRKVDARSVKLDIPLPTAKARQRLKKTPRFIPIIKAGDRRSWFWRWVAEPRTVIVKLHDLMVSPELSAQAEAEGLRGYLNLDGQTIVSTVMPDEAMARLSLEDYQRYLKSLEPDAFFNPDSETYIDDPRLYSWRSLLRSLKMTSELAKLDAELIGLIKGANREQVRYCVKTLSQLSVTKYALPSRELWRDGLFKEFLAYALEALEDYVGGRYQLIIYGRPYTWATEYPHASLSWFINAQKRACYQGTQPIIHYILDDHLYCDECPCNCPACQEIKEEQVTYIRVNNVKAIALHNLTYLQALHSEGGTRKLGFR
ncbi:MAG: hypothetical protein DRJ97_02575 [Thermoprotei archaeon]|nr:MAG: hypothetical protein DRJ97_02575 [Thermoprotei archaeon]